MKLNFIAIALIASFFAYGEDAPAPATPEAAPVAAAPAEAAPAEAAAEPAPTPAPVVESAPAPAPAPVVEAAPPTEPATAPATVENAAPAPEAVPAPVPAEAVPQQAQTPPTPPEEVPAAAPAAPLEQVQTAPTPAAPAEVPTAEPPQPTQEVQAVPTAPPTEPVAPTPAPATETVKAPAPEQERAPAAAEPKETKIVEKVDADDPEFNEAKKKLADSVLKKLTKSDGQVANILLSLPIDFTGQQLADPALETMKEAIGQFGYFNMREYSHAVENLTLEEVHRLVSRYQADVFIVTAFKNTDFNIYLYDKRTPYQIYAYTENLAEGAVKGVNPRNVRRYAKMLVRKVLGEYVEGRNYEIPREPASSVLTAEIPRRIASVETLSMVNKEINSKYYLGANVGIAVVNSPKGSFQSNVISLQAAIRTYKNLYFESAVELFSYNSFVNSFKYFFTSRESPIKASVGIGFGLSSYALVMVYDSSKSFPGNNSYLVPNVAFMVPLVDAYFKLESRLYYGLARKGMVYTIMPGVLINF